MAKGRTVRCIDPDSPHIVDRTVCLGGQRAYCSICPHRRFTLGFQFRVVDQTVACPRWASDAERVARRDPIDYVSVSRYMCINVRPFIQCEGCPNADAGESPRVCAKWWEEAEHNRKIELQLDEEEKG